MTTTETTYRDAMRIRDLMLTGRTYRQSWRELGLDRLSAWNAKRYLKREDKWTGGEASPIVTPNPDKSTVIPATVAPLSPLPVFAQSKWSIPASTMKPFDSHERLTGNIAFLSDLHVPFHSRQVIEGCMNVSDTLGVKHLVLGGDCLDNGTWHKKRGDFRCPYKWQDAAEQFESILNVLLECYDRITVISGNHDGWWTSHFKGEVDGSWMLSRLFRNEHDRIKFSDYERADLTSGGKEWTLLHGANYSATNPLGVAQKYASKYGTSVVMGHQHVSAEGFDPSSRHHCICAGGAHDPSLMGYTHTAPRTNPKQVQGYAIIQDGVGRLFKYVDNEAV